MVAGGSGSCTFSTAAIPAVASSQARRAPAASSARSVASVISGPMPSPRMSVTIGVVGVVGSAMPGGVRSRAKKVKRAARRDGGGAREPRSHRGLAVGGEDRRQGGLERHLAAVERVAGEELPRGGGHLRRPLVAERVPTLDG